jgi:hypothetical protein
LGHGVSGKDAQAGRMGYELLTSGALDIIGAGTVAGSRGIQLSDNVTIPGTLAVSSTLSTGPVIIGSIPTANLGYSLEVGGWNSNNSTGGSILLHRRLTFGPQEGTSTEGNMVWNMDNFSNTFRIFRENPRGQVGNVAVNINNTSGVQFTNDFHIANNSGAWNTTFGKGLYMRYSTNSG